MALTQHEIDALQNKRIDFFIKVDELSEDAYYMNLEGFDEDEVYTVSDRADYFDAKARKIEEVLLSTGNEL